MVGYLFIFLARVADVSLATVRVLLIFRGRKVEAALIGFFEVMIFVTALAQVVNRLDNWLNVLAYAGGFATGNLVGGLVEERLAFGHVATQIISGGHGGELRDAIREDGFGLTVLRGEGRGGPRNVLLVISRRRELGRLTQLIDRVDSEAVVVMTDARRSIRAFSPGMSLRKGK
jgi:uncharacterized protein YebE (UPF0316 family)